MSALTAFTTQLSNLSNNLVELYPNDPDLQFTKTSISLLKSTNPRKLQQMFHKYLPQYKEQIMNKNESFLKEHDFVSDTDAAQNSKDTQDYANSIMTNLKKYWNDIDEESKDNIWKYLQVLIKLDEKCC